MEEEVGVVWSGGRKKEGKWKDKIYLELFLFSVRDPQADPAQVSVPRGSLKDTEGTPDHDFPKDRYKGQIPSLSTLPAPQVPGTNARNLQCRHVSIDTGRRIRRLLVSQDNDGDSNESWLKESESASQLYCSLPQFLFSDFPC